MIAKLGHPLPTLSALAYPVAGVVLASYVPGGASLVMACFLLALGVGSAWTHSERSGLGSILDRSAMEATFCALALYCAGAPWWWMLAGGTASGVLIEWRFKLQAEHMMGVWLVICIGGVLGGGSLVLLSLSVLVFGAGFTLWLTDRRGDGGFGHSLWHIGTAAGIALMYVAG